MQKSGLDDAHLLDILRTKDGQIVDLEIASRDQQKVIDLQENQVGKLKDEIRTYQTMLEVSSKTILSEKLWKSSFYWHLFTLHRSTIGILFDDYP